MSSTPCRRENTQRTFLSLAAGSSVDAKLDIPTTALITNLTGGVELVGVEQDSDAPEAAQAAGLIRMTLTFPSFQSLSYDPTTAFATSDTTADTSLNTTLSSNSSTSAGLASSPAIVSFALSLLAGLVLLTL